MGMSATPTPETDSVAAHDGNWDTKALRMTDHARKLERERDEAREALREIQAAEWKTSGELRGMARTALEAAK